MNETSSLISAEGSLLPEEFPLANGVENAPNFVTATSGLLCESASQCSSAESTLEVLETNLIRKRNFVVGSFRSHSSPMRELERYFPNHLLRVFVATWNMHSEKDTPLSIDDLVLPYSCETLCEIYVFCCQEFSANKLDWNVLLQESLGEQYVLLKCSTYGSLSLSIFIRRDLIWYCSVPLEKTVQTRPFTPFKTKGCVSISFELFGSRFLFISSHFSSGPNKSEKRIKDYQITLDSLGESETSVNDVRNISNKRPADVESADNIFWSGDFNFRLTGDYDSVIHRIGNLKANEIPDFEAITQHDELIRGMNDGVIFKNFQEGRITFLPTYKFNMDTDNYDYDTETIRVPSYTDRILFRCKEKHTVTCQLYSSVNSLFYSDHRPVIGVFETMIEPGGNEAIRGAGEFDRLVYKEGMNQRRVRHAQVNRRSTACSIQ